MLSVLIRGFLLASRVARFVRFAAMLLAILRVLRRPRRIFAALAISAASLAAQTTVFTIQGVQHEQLGFSIATASDVDGLSDRAIDLARVRRAGGRVRRVSSRRAAATSL
jgi:hypothetical protein